MQPVGTQGFLNGVMWGPPCPCSLITPQEHLFLPLLLMESPQDSRQHVANSQSISMHNLEDMPLTWMQGALRPLTFPSMSSCILREPLENPCDVTSHPLLSPLWEGCLYMEAV